MIENLNILKKIKDDFISIICSKEKLYLNKRCIICITREGRRTKYVCINSELLVYDSLNNIEKILPDNYVRCSNGCIVNMYFCKKYKDSKLYMRNGRIVDVSRTFKRRVEEYIAKMHRIS
ncbi:MAG: LytTR family transcriptional regulator [Lachnospiraceae bacterium]|nr:LytTR family transcriptional regulator [Lachnospiraceae bacterium]